jgi:hypothetical protein
MSAKCHKQKSLQLSEGWDLGYLSFRHGKRAMKHGWSGHTTENLLAFVYLLISQSSLLLDQKLAQAKVFPISYQSIVAQARLISDHPNDWADLQA